MTAPVLLFREHWRAHACSFLCPGTAVSNFFSFPYPRLTSVTSFTATMREAWCNFLTPLYTVAFPFQLLPLSCNFCSLKVACASCLPGRRINLISLQGLVAYANPLVLALGCFSSSSSTLPQKLRLSRPCSRALEEAGLHRKMCLLFPKMSFSK